MDRSGAATARVSRNSTFRILLINDETNATGKNYCMKNIVE